MGGTPDQLGQLELRPGLCLGEHVEGVVGIGRHRGLAVVDRLRADQVRGVAEPGEMGDDRCGGGDRPLEGAGGPVAW